MTSQPPTLTDAGLDPIHVVLPLRSLAGGKARLGEALDPEEREELVLGLLLHTLAVLGGWHRGQHIHLVSPDPDLRGLLDGEGAGLSVHHQVDGGLNEGLRMGIEAASRADATSVLVLPGDLPLLASEALDGLVFAADAGLAAAAGAPLVAIAPSETRGGTNALLLRPPDVIAPAFGSDSFEAHLRAAMVADAAVQVVHDAILGFDLDTPEDLERLEPVRLRELTRLGRAALERVGA